MRSIGRHPASCYTAILYTREPTRSRKWVADTLYWRRGLGVSLGYQTQRYFHVEVKSLEAYRIGAGIWLVEARSLAKIQMDLDLDGMERALEQQDVRCKTAKAQWRKENQCLQNLPIQHRQYLHQLEQSQKEVQVR